MFGPEVPKIQSILKDMNASKYGNMNYPIRTCFRMSITNYVCSVEMLSGLQFLRHVLPLYSSSHFIKKKSFAEQNIRILLPHCKKIKVIIIITSIITSRTFRFFK